MTLQTTELLGVSKKSHWNKWQPKFEAIHGLLTTHFVENAAGEAEEKATVIPLPATKLQPDDVNVFRLSRRDVIREVADTPLTPGTRDASSIWREALLRSVEDHNLPRQKLRRSARKCFDIAA